MKKRTILPIIILMFSFTIFAGAETAETTAPAILSGTVITNEGLDYIRESGKIFSFTLENGIILSIDPAKITDTAKSVDLDVKVFITPGLDEGWSEWVHDNYLWDYDIYQCPLCRHADCGYNEWNDCPKCGEELEYDSQKEHDYCGNTACGWNVGGEGYYCPSCKGVCLAKEIDKYKCPLCGHADCGYNEVHDCPKCGEELEYDSQKEHDYCGNADCGWNVGGEGYYCPSCRGICLVKVNWEDPDVIEWEGFIIDPEKGLVIAEREFLKETGELIYEYIDYIEESITLIPAQQGDYGFEITYTIPARMTRAAFGITPDEEDEATLVLVSSDNTPYDDDEDFIFEDCFFNPDGSVTLHITGFEGLAYVLLGFGYDYENINLEVSEYGNWDYSNYLHETPAGVDWVGREYILQQFKTDDRYTNFAVPFNDAPQLFAKENIDADENPPSGVSSIPVKLLTISILSAILSKKRGKSK